MSVNPLGKQGAGTAGNAGGITTDNGGAILNLKRINKGNNAAGGGPTLSVATRPETQSTSTQAVNSGGATTGDNRTSPTGGTGAGGGAPPNRYRIGNYVVEKALGEGNFAKVKLASHITTGDKVAIKIIDKSKLNTDAIQKLSREVKVLKLLNHPHIIRLYEVLNSPRELILVMEYAPGGEMHDFIRANGRLREEDARRFFRQICSALEQCHRLRIVHRDLKTENLLLDEKMDLKLVDFGFGNLYDPRSHLNTHCGSPPFASPELFQGKDYIGPEIDMWAAGVMLYVFLTGALPFGSGNFNDTRKRVLDGKFRIPFYVSSEAASLLNGLLHPLPSKRMTISDLRRHPWMNVGLEEPVPSVDANAVVKLTPEEEERVYEEIRKMEISVDAVKKSVQHNSYDEYSAYYYLMADKLFHKREAMAKEHLHEDRVPISPRIAPSDVPLDDVRARLAHTSLYYNTGLFGNGLRKAVVVVEGEGVPKGKGNKVAPASIVAATGPGSPMVSSPSNRNKVVPTGSYYAGSSIGEERLPPVPLHFTIHVRTILQPRDIFKRLAITLIRELGMTPVLPLDLSLHTPLSTMLATLATGVDRSALPVRLAEGAKYYCGMVADLPWTVRIVEKNELTRELGQELDVEVCRRAVWWCGRVYGLRFRRRAGDVWRYQELCGTIVKKGNFTPQ